MQNYLLKAHKMINKGNWSAAAKYLKKALSNNPNNAQITYALGEVLIQTKDTDQALKYLYQALSSTEREPCWFFTYAVALKQKGKYEEAEKAFLAAERSGCSSDGFYLSHGKFHRNLTKKFDLAESNFLRLIRQNRTFNQAYLEIAKLYNETYRHDEALEALDQCLSNNYENEEVYLNLGIALSNQGRQEESLECHKKALQMAPDNQVVISGYIVQLLYTVDDQREIHNEIRRITKSINQKSTKKFTGKKDCSPGRLLRLGFVSGDLNSHAIAFYMAPIIINISKEKFAIYIYYNNTIYDEITSKIKSYVDHWRECLDLSDSSLVSTIKKDKIDILIDLSNHSALNRLSMFTKKPAPIQIAWMGMPASTGLHSMDYWLKDSSIFSVPDIENCCSEKILPVDNLHWFDPIHDLPDIVEPPCLDNGFITFGSLNTLRKLTTTTINTWAEILHRIPGSKIRMIIADYHNENMQEHIYNIFAEHKISKERVLLQERLLLDEFLESFNKIDIVLDPYPYSGQTTTYHSLTMGVPVITCTGKSLASSITAAILAKLGREDWIATNLNHYIDIAEILANDTKTLVTNRTSLRTELMNSSLADFTKTTRNLEDTLTSVWNKYCGNAKVNKKI